LGRYLNGEKVGAIWHIFLAEDSSKIRTFLNKGEKKDNDDDPIHDQTNYINIEMLEILKKEFNVEPFVIIQYLGDAVFIPAGAPHQVK